jgi:predicted NUDIX family NTP pyrophosphohydrolase
MSRKQLDRDGRCAPRCVAVLSFNQRLKSVKKQFAALPFRVKFGAPIILLITTRKKGVWAIPKGSPIAGRLPWETARIEAFEEAGVSGSISGPKLATYRKRKSRGGKGDFRIEIYPLQVNRDLKSWPESNARKRCWVTSKEAIRRVRSKSLKRALRSISFHELVAHKKSRQDLN